MLKKFLWENTTESNNLESRRRRRDNIKTDLRNTGCDDGRWKELARCRDQWRALGLAVLNLQFLLQI